MYTLKVSINPIEGHDVPVLESSTDLYNLPDFSGWLMVIAGSLLEQIISKEIAINASQIQSYIGHPDLYPPYEIAESFTGLNPAAQSKIIKGMGEVILSDHVGGTPRFSYTVTKTLEI